MKAVAADAYKPNYLMNTVACKSSEPILTMLEAARDGNHSAANSLMRMSMMSGECKVFSLVMYQPEAVIEQWEEDDGTGGPGAVVAGWIIGPEGEKSLRAFMWLAPELLTKWFNHEAI